MSGLKDSILHRIGWRDYLKPFLYKELPPNLGWSSTLGSLCALLFVVQAATGILLAMYYNPSPDKAYQSINFIQNEVYLGRILQAIHHWGASAMVIAVFVHMLANFFSGSFKAPREITWMVGVCLFLLTLGLGFTGYLLPWDQKAYWATVVSSNVPGDIPVIGRFLKQLLLAGDTVSGLTLTRFYSIHMLAFPALLVFLSVFHVYLVRIHGVAEHPVSLSSGRKLESGKEGGLYRFFPEQLARSSVVFAIVFALIILLAIFAEVPREKIAGTLDESYLPRPEWYFMWLFQLLTFFSGSTELIGSLVVPVCAVLLLFAIPFLNRSTLRAIADRPFAAAFGTSCIIGLAFLTWMGVAGARPYGDTVVVPDRKLSALQAEGLRVFVDRECAYCHQILGKGGRKEGPDLSNVIARGRTKEWLSQSIRDPKLVSRWTTMPKYDLSEAELNALVEFILSLDFDHYAPKTLQRKEILPATPTHAR